MTLATVPRSEVAMMINVYLHMLGFCLSLVFAAKYQPLNIREKKTNNLDKLF